MFKHRKQKKRNEMQQMVSGKYDKHDSMRTNNIIKRVKQINGADRKKSLRRREKMKNCAEY